MKFCLLTGTQYDLDLSRMGNAKICCLGSILALFYKSFLIIAEVVINYFKYVCLKNLMSQLWRDIPILGQSKFRCNIFISLCGRLCNFLQESWWPLDCVWKWYRNHISNLLFWIAVGVFLSDSLFFFQQNGVKNWWNFSNKTEIRTDIPCQVRLFPNNILQ